MGFFEKLLRKRVSQRNPFSGFSEEQTALSKNAIILNKLRQ